MPNNCATNVWEGANIKNNLIATMFNIQQKRLDNKNRANLDIDILVVKVKTELAIKLKRMPAVYPTAFDAYTLNPQCMKRNMNRAVIAVFASPTKAYRVA